MPETYHRSAAEGTAMLPRPRAPRRLAELRIRRCGRAFAAAPGRDHGAPARAARPRDRG